MDEVLLFLPKGKDVVKRRTAWNEEDDAGG